MKGLLIKLLFFLLFTLSRALWDSCDNTVQLKDNEKGITIQSPKYPFKEFPGTETCWKVESPPNSRIFVSCPNVDQPKEDPCGGFFTVLIDEETSFSFCRDKRFTQTSVGNKMVIEYKTKEDSEQGWSFRCYLSVVVDSEPAPGKGECNCGRSHTARILNGENAGANEFPMMALLKCSKGECGATIISSSYALTAAHCIGEEEEDVCHIYVGETNREKLFQTQKIEIDRITKASPTLFQKADLALLHTKTPIEFNERVGPACLPFSQKDKDFESETIYVVGWGKNGTIVPENLQKVSLTILEANLCRENRPDITSDMICAGTIQKNAMEGDSGGPMLWLDLKTMQLKLVGVMIRGYLPGQNSSYFGSVATRVASYLGWIEAQTEGTVFCKI